MSVRHRPDEDVGILAETDDVLGIGVFCCDVRYIPADTLAILAHVVFPAIITRRQRHSQNNNLHRNTPNP